MTVYRTDCGCIASSPEPSPAEYADDRDFAAAHAAWVETWESEAAEHTIRCPASAYHSDTLLTYERIKEAAR